jgi:hypothetical protein
MHGASDAIVIIPQPSAFAQGPQLLGPNATHHNEGAPDIIVITPTVNYECQDPIHTRSEQGRANINRGSVGQIIQGARMETYAQCHMRAGQTIVAKADGLFAEGRIQTVTFVEPEALLT